MFTSGKAANFIGDMIFLFMVSTFIYIFISVKKYHFSKKTSMEKCSHLCDGLLPSCCRSLKEMLDLYEEINEENYLKVT